MSAPDRREMLDRADKALSVRRQCALLGVARSGVYRPRKPANDNDLGLMRRIDELFTAWPFLRLAPHDADAEGRGREVNRKRVQRLMRKMGIAALGPKPRHEQAGAGPQDLPLSAAQSGDRAAEPRLGRGYHVISDRPRLPLSGGDHRLGEPRGSGVAHLQYDGHVLLPRRA